jgi:hypothetical protein
MHRENKLAHLKKMMLTMAGLLEETSAPYSITELPEYGK